MMLARRTGAACPHQVMLHVKIAELKAHLSEHLRAVEGGGEVIVTDRDRPIARIVPYEEGGALRLQPSVVPFAEVRRRTWVHAAWAVSSSVLLAEERRGR